MASIVPVSMVAALVCRVLFAVLSVINIFGNTLVILSVARLRSMHTAMNYLLVNLAVSDGLVAIFLLPRYVFNDMLHYPKDVRADIMCKFFTHGTISWVGLHAGVFTLIAISFERYGAVVHPHSIRGRLTKSKLKLVLVACWLYAVGFIMPDFVYVRYSLEKGTCIYDWPETIQKTWAFLWFFTCGPIPLVTMGYLYGRVVYDLWIKKNRVADSSRKAVLKSRKHVTKMVITVAVIYALCWLPNLTLWLLYNFFKEIPHMALLYRLTHVFLLFNSSANSFVYSIQSERFRKAVKEILCLCSSTNLDEGLSTNACGLCRRGSSTNLDEGLNTNACGLRDRTRYNSCHGNTLKSRSPSASIKPKHVFIQSSIQPTNVSNRKESAKVESSTCDDRKIMTIENGFDNKELHCGTGKVDTKCEIQNASSQMNRKTNSCCREIDQLKPIMEMTAKGHGFKLQDHLTVIVDKEARQERIDEGRNVLTAAKIKRKRRRKKKQNYDINLEQ